MSRTLRVGTAAALGIDAAVHARDASADDTVKATVSQGELFRVEAGLAIVVGLLVLIRPRRSSWVAALLVAASALVAVLLYRYVDLGSLGPVPDMYENTWQVPGKLLSASAEGVAVVLAALGLLTHRDGMRRRASSGSQRWTRFSLLPEARRWLHVRVRGGAVRPAATADWRPGCHLWREQAKEGVAARLTLISSVLTWWPSLARARAANREPPRRNWSATAGQEAMCGGHARPAEAGGSA